MNAAEIFKMNTDIMHENQEIEMQTLNSSGVRDIERNLVISKNTVISAPKKI